MSVEKVDNAQAAYSEYSSEEVEESSSWEGREVALNNIGELSELHQLAGAILAKELKGDPNYYLCSGNASIEASADNEGNKEVEATVEVSNDEGNVSVNAGGSISQDSSGNTSAEVKAGVTITW